MGHFTYIYARASTKKQEVSAEVQIQTCKRYIQEHELPALSDDLIIEARANAVSGKVPFARRPGGMRLLRMMRPGDVLVVAKMDRLGRNSRDILNTVYLFERLKVDLYICDFFGKVYDPNDPLSKLFLTLIAAAAEFENSLRSQRQIEANQIRRQKGLPTNNQAGYGRKIVNGRIVPDPVEQARINKVYELYMRGVSVASIHRDVSSRWIHNGKPWNYSRTSHVLQFERKRREGEQCG